MYIDLMPGENVSETSNEAHSIGEQIFNDFKKNNHDPINKETVINQVKILRRLPNDFLEQAYGHLRSEFLLHQKYNQNRIETKNYFNDEQLLAGFANEVLVNIQIRQTHPELRGGTNPETKAELDNYESKILEVANNPERFELPFDVGRNPDVAWLDLDLEGRVIIKGVGEITTSNQFNKRKFLQLSESGFASNLRNISRHLNSLTDGDSRGLPEFGVDKKQIEVSPKLKRYLIVRRDMDTTPAGLANVIGKTVSDEEYSHLDNHSKKKVFSSTERQSFINLLTSPDTVIIKSEFSNNECRLIANLLIRMIQEKYPYYKFENINGR